MASTFFSLHRQLFLFAGFLALFMTGIAQAQNQAPTISAITGTGVDGSGNLVLDEDGDITVNFTVADAETAGASLTVSGTRTNTTLFASVGTDSTSRLRLATVSGGSRSLRVRPAANLSGTSSVTLTVTDEGGLTASLTFDIGVNPVNDLPSFTKGANREHFRNEAGPQSAPAWATAINDGDAEVSQALTFQATVVSGASIFTVPPALSVTGTLTYTLSGAPGLATVEVSLTDDATAGGAARSSAVQTFTVGAHASVERQVVARIHTDAVSTFFDDGEFELGTKADLAGEYGVRLDPAYVWFHVDNASAVTLQSGFEFIAAQGSQVWIAPEINPGGAQLWAGFSTESVPEGTIDNDQTTFSIVGFTGPGHLELYTSGEFGGPVNRLWSTDEGISSFSVTGQVHMHANWAFTAAGKYEITVEAEVLIDGEARTSRATYTFFVGNTLPVAQATQITLVSSTSSTILNTPVLLSASVSPTAAAGWIEFLNGTTLMGSRVLANGAASLEVPNFPLGNHSITARFVPFEVNYFPPATSAPVAVSITEEWGVPFGIRANKDVYQPGDIITLEVVGVTPAAGEVFWWRGYPKNLPTVSNYYTLGSKGAASTTISFEATPGMDGMEIWVGLMPAGQHGAPIAARFATSYYPEVEWTGASTGEQITLNGLQQEYYHGEAAQFAVEHRPLVNGETGRWVRRTSGRLLGSAAWSSTTVPQGTHPNYSIPTVVGTGFATHEFRYQILDAQTQVIGQSAVIQPHIRRQDLTISGLVGIYRAGGTLNATASFYPPLLGVTYQWGVNLSANPNGTGPISGATNQTLQTVVQSNWNARNLYVQVLLNGTVLQRTDTSLVVTEANPGERLLLVPALGSHGDHYHTGDMVQLRAYPDPVAASSDTFQWFWMLPGETQWKPIPGAAAAFSDPFRGEAALHNTRIKVEQYDENGVMLGLTDAGFIKINDHGYAPPQRVAVHGMQPQYHAGDMVNLSVDVTAYIMSPATIMPGRQWYVKLPGQSTAQAIPGATGPTYAFLARYDWHGAEISAAVVRSDGQVIYGPSPVLSLHVSSGNQTTWRETHFGTGANTGDAADNADPDFDGVPNLLEYAFGLNPRQGPDGMLRFTGGGLDETGPPMVGSQHGGGGEAMMYACFARRKNAAALGLNYTVSFTADLVQWEVSAAVPTVLGEAGDMEVVGVPFPAVQGQAARFFRVTVHNAP